jgi:hypothetical protein
VPAVAVGHGVAGVRAVAVGIRVAVGDAGGRVVADGADPATRVVAWAAAGRADQLPARSRACAANQ